jgi:hypothetical protein
MAETQRRVTLFHHEKIEYIVEAINNLDKEMKRIVEEQTKMRRWSIGIGIGALILGIGVGVGVALLMRKRS